MQHGPSVSTQHAKEGTVTINHNEAKLLIGLEKLVQGLVWH